MARSTQRKSSKQHKVEGMSKQPIGHIQSSASQIEKKELGIAIIGAGIAGLYCGYRLSEKGHTDFLIAEATKHIGGKILSTRILQDKTTVPDGEELNGSARLGFHYGKDKSPLEFCAEFGPMRIELELQKYLEELIESLGLRDDLEPFPPYESPTSDQDPKYALTGEECDQKTPMDLLKLAVVRIMGRLRNSTETSRADDTKIDSHNRISLDNILHRLIDKLARATATHQWNWQEILQKWAKTLGERDYQNIRQYGVFDDGTDAGTPLWDMGFWNLLSEVLSHHAVLKIRDLGTFYHLIPENPNAAEWLIFWLRAFRTTQQLVGVRGGMQRITEKMTKRINEKAERIIVDRKLIGIQEDGNRIKLTFADSNGHQVAEWYAAQVILALPTGSLEELVILNSNNLYHELNRDLTAVFGFPLLKLFFAVSEQWWDKDESYTNRYATLIPTRELHYRSSYLKESSKGLILIYTDRPALTFWSNYIKHDDESNGKNQSELSQRWKTLIPSGVQKMPEMGSPEKNPRLINKLIQYMNEYGVRKEPKDLEFYGIRDWGREPYLGAAHAWYPERRSWEILKRLSAFAIGNYSLDQRAEHGSDLNVHICGEAYSDYQAFIEGALRSAEHVLHTVNPKDFPFSPTPWLCSPKCTYSDTDKEIKRLEANKEMPCENT